MVVLEKRDLIAKGALSAYANIESFLTTIAQTNGAINAVLHLNPDALQDAKRVDEKRAANKPLGKLAGLGIIIKSNICVKGLITSCASKTLETYKATYDADVVAKIKAEDGIIIGMANMDEFACGASGEYSAFGRTDNPAAPGRIPGGSSSGSAASVAAGYCDIALGSDTGGSIRNPASHCGVYGVKPSYGRVSRYGLIDLSMSLDQIGPLCADLDGCALMLDVISGYSANDPTTVETPALSCTKPTGSSLRFGVSSSWNALCTDTRILDMVMAKVQHTNPVDLTINHVDLAIQTYYPLVYVEFFSATRKFDGRKYGKVIEESAQDEVLRRIYGGMEISKAEHEGKFYRTALAIKDAIAESMREALSKVDVIALPTTPQLPHAFGTAISVEAMYAYDAFTIPANLAGVCAGVMPLGKLDGVPVGLQLYAKDEVALIEAMRQLK